MKETLIYLLDVTEMVRGWIEKAPDNCSLLERWLYQDDVRFLKREILPLYDEDTQLYLYLKKLLTEIIAGFYCIDTDFRAKRQMAITELGKVIDMLKAAIDSIESEEDKESKN